LDHIVNDSGGGSFLVKGGLTGSMESQVAGVWGADAETISAFM